MKRRVTAGALTLIILLCVTAGSVTASDLDALWMSSSSSGPPQTDFASGTETVYVVFEYTGFIRENVRVVVSDHTGEPIFDETERFSGSGMASISVTYGQQAFPDGLYVTTLYFAGEYLTAAVEWTVGGVDLPATPTPQPPARLDVEPAALTFSAQQGGQNPSAQRVLVSNSTAAASVWHADTPAHWLNLVPEGGETPALLRVSVDVTGLPAGAYEAQITVRADDVADSPQTVAVRMTIAAPAETTTLDLPAIATGTGWVVSDESSGNHFGDDEIWSGLLDEQAYLGALAFDLSPISDGADIRAAAVLLPALRWEAEPAEGTWILELMAGELAEDWAERGYVDLANAAPAAALMPDHLVENLDAGSESIWYLDTATIAVLESVVGGAGKGVMRLRYEPAAPPDPGGDAPEGLFVWDEAGVLRVNFEPTAGPVATATPAGMTVTVTPVEATLTATRTPSVLPATPTATRTPSVVPATATLTPGAPPPPPPPPGGKQRPLESDVTELPGFWCW